MLVKEYRICVSASGTPYVVYQDMDYSSGTTVMMFDGTAWKTVGSHCFSKSEAESISMTLSPSGFPYVTYSDYGNSWKVTVMRPKQK